jgi:hypothetical protein
LYCLLLSPLTLFPVAVTQLLSSLRLTYHYNNAIPSDSGMTIYKEALKYSLLTTSLFLRMGNFSQALDYLEYAETLARTHDEFLQIMAILKSAGDIVNSSDDQIAADPLLSPSSSSTHSSSPHPTPHSGSQAQIAKMFYQQNILGSAENDFLYDDYLELYKRIKEKALRTGDGGRAAAEEEEEEGDDRDAQPLSHLSLKPAQQEISLHPSSSHDSHPHSYCTIS